MTRWRLGADLGTNSLGWCAVELNADGAPFRIIAMGSRIFSDGRDAKSKQSLAVDRREARGARRRRDRYKQRQEALLKHLTETGLFPAPDDHVSRADLQSLDPFELRARALHAPLTPHEIGRAFFHLNQRRGFKSNRRTDRAAEKDTGKIRVGVERLVTAMQAAKAETLGAFLHARRAAATDQNHTPTVRTRLRPESGPDAKGDGYDFYPDRALLESEFDAIIAAQRPHHPNLLTEAVEKTLREIIFHQRPLKAPRIGMCTLVPGEQRLPKAHPLFQRRRLLEELNALRIVRVGETPQPLTLEQRDLLLLKLKGQKEVAFKTLRKHLKLDPEARFNKESENRDKLAGDEIAATMLDKKRFGPGWNRLTIETQWLIIEKIRTAESEAQTVELRAWLAKEYDLPPAQAAATADAFLPEGFGRFGETATRKLIEVLQAAVVVYSDAVTQAGLGHHSDFRTGEILSELPYYGEVLERHILPGSGDPNDAAEKRFGKLTNPTVHIGLNQIRRLVNRLIKTYGPPAEIALELARELKLDDKRKAEQNSHNRQNREAAEQRAKKLEEIGIQNKGGNRLIVKLWEELNRENVLDRRCIYSGAQISIEMLFSGAVEIDHILPFSLTLDDSQSNLILCTREANREKRNQPPFTAFGRNPDKWAEIKERAARLPKEKRWRFEPDAMHRFDRDGGFLARQLIDTQHLSKLAREYLSSLYPDRGEGSSHVWVSPGRLTEMLRRSWGLNSLLPDHNYAGGADQPKNRLDHRHHAIDALVVAVTDRALLQRIATAAGRHGEEEARRITSDLPEPWSEFRETAKMAVHRIVVTHRPDHGTVSKAALPKGHDTTAGRLHNDTAYGLTGRKENGIDLVVHRVPLTDLKPDDFGETGRRVADPKLREALRGATQGTDGKDFTQALIGFSKKRDTHFEGIRRVRVVEPLSVIPIRNKAGVAYKAYKGDANYRYDVWEVAGGKWVSEVVSMFDAHQPGWCSEVRRNNHNARKVLSLQCDDVIALDRNGSRELMRVVKFSERQLALAPPNEGGSLKARDADKADPFRYAYPSPNTLKAWGARQVRIDELGRLQDPGPRSPKNALA